jgi:hypothetical protein
MLHQEKAPGENHWWEGEERVACGGPRLGDLAASCSDPALPPRIERARPIGPKRRRSAA